MVRAVVFDLDGVLRHFDSATVAEIERRHGFEPGLIDREAFAEPDLTQVTTGRITRAEWTRRIGARLKSPAAALEWSRLPARVDRELLVLIGRLREAGRVCAILTNGTDTVPDELADLGLSEQVDRVFNSASIGYIKPDRRVFEHVLAELGLAGPEVFFTDDSARKLAGARDVGMVTHHYRGLPGLRRALQAAGVAVEFADGD